MKLGIVVVYLVEEDNEPLLRLHWQRIERYTGVPYRIYGSAARLLPRFRPALDAHPRLTVCDVPPTDLRSSPEHAYYLDRLVEVAVADGVTHVAVLHVDSFPVRRGWAEDLAARLEGSCVLAGVMRSEMRDDKPLTAGMLFHRDFYLRYRPTFLLSDAQRAEAGYQRYRAMHDHIPDSGVGYGYTVFASGLTWHRLPLSNRAQDHPRVGAIYGDVFFHLGFAARPDDALAGAVSGLVRRRPLLGAVVRRLVPEAVWRGAPGPAWRRLLAGVARHGGSAYRQSIFEAIRQRLLDDPDGYIEYLRTGRPAPSRG